MADDPSSGHYQRLQSVTCNVHHNFPADTLCTSESLDPPTSNVIIPGDRVLFVEEHEFELCENDLPNLFDDHDNTIFVAMSVGRQRSKFVDGNQVTHRLCYPIGYKRSGVYIPEN